MTAATRSRLSRQGMTMMELLIVIVMIGIMSAMIIPRLRTTPRRMVQESARQLARDIDLVRSRALGTKRTARLALVGTTAWIAYRDVEGDAVINEIQAEADSMRGFGQRTLDPQVLLGRGTATPLSGWPTGDPTSFTGSRLNFKGNGMTQPFGTQGIIYLRHRDDPAVVAAVTVTGAGSVRVWTYRGGHMAMNRRGFTLISVMIAVVILAVGVLALSRTLTGAMQANSRAGMRTIALDIARQRMEFLRSQEPTTMGDFAEVSGTDVNEEGRPVTGGKYRRTVIVADVRTALVSVTVRVTYPNGTTPVELITYVYTGAVT